MLSARGIAPIVLLIGLAVFVLAMGAATLNSLQERVEDGQLTRTASRPLVRSEISPFAARVQAAVLLAGGLMLLYFSSPSPWSTVLGGGAILLYNGIYTPLKRITLLSIIPGAVCGALPPLIGWFGVGGQLSSFTVLLLFFLLFLWQVPHFCLVLLRHQDDYLRTRQPNFLRLLSERSVRWLSCIWIFSLALVMMLFIIALSPIVSAFQILIILNCLIFTGLINYDLLMVSRPGYKKVFIHLNMMLSFHMVLSMLAVAMA